MLAVFTISGSSLYDRILMNEDPEEQLEYRMNRKSQSAAYYIPQKWDIAGDIEPAELPSMDVFLYSESPALQFYRNYYTRNAVIDFFVSLAGSEEVAIPVMYYADRHDLPFTLVFSLIHTESRFLPRAVNRNATSTDRGVFQLNDRAFPHLREDDFFDPDLNARYGVAHLEWCLKVSRDLDEALAIYNAGYGKVRSGVIPDSTREYIRKIHAYRENLSREFYLYLMAEIPRQVVNLAALPSL